MILAAIVIVAILIFGAGCYYASWEVRIDRRRQKRLEDREYTD